MMMHSASALMLLLLVLLHNIFSSTSSSSSLDANDLYSWIVKSVCADLSSDKVLAFDPYYPCPTNAYLRKLKIGERFYYNNYEQMNNQISDSFALLDAQRNPLYIHTFDYYPFNQFNQHSGSDGYDVYHIDNSTVSYSNTKDGGGYGSTFYGDKCQFGNGWVLFPSYNFLTSPTSKINRINNDNSGGGEGYWPIAGVYWEQSGESYPGPCPGGYSKNTNTLWELQPAFKFGGVNGNVPKAMDTLVSYHGYESDDGVNPTTNFVQHGHLEVFYFTKEYGITRWEVWAPAAVVGSKPSSSSPIADSMSECSGSSIGTYKTLNFTKINCHDWSNVKILTESVLPAWPLVNGNLLKHFHFESSKCLSGNTGVSSNGLWQRFGTSINWSVQTSSGGSDNNNGNGITFLSVNCGSSCGESGSQAVYQDIALAASELSTPAGNTILYGINAKTADNDVSASGTLQIALQVLSGDMRRVLWQDVTTCYDLKVDNGDGRAGESDSEYLSSKFIYNVVTLPIIAEPVTLRFLIIPNTLNTFHIIDAFVNPFPTIV